MILKRMSSCDRESMGNSESLEFPIKSEMEDSFSHTAIKLENNDLVDNVGLFDDGFLFMDPLKEFKAEPEVFESSEGDMKYSFDSDASVSEEGLQISKREVNKEEESVKIGVKEECDIQLGSSMKEDEGNRRGMGKEYFQNEKQIENSGCEKPLCQESDSTTPTDDGMREKSFVGGNYEKQFSGVVNSNTQMLIHTGGQFRCREFGKTFSKQVDLKAHDDTHTRRKPFKCYVCDKAFHRTSKLTIHYRIHTGENKCSLCHKAFSQRSTLKRHFRIHTREKPFNCSVCDKAFSHRSVLTRHFIIHTRKLLGCHECGKEFTKKGNLKRHFRIHMGEKPFKCRDCDMAFTYKSSLSKHMKICSGENL